MRSIHGVFDFLPSFRVPLGLNFASDFSIYGAPCYVSTKAMYFLKCITFEEVLHSRISTLGLLQSVLGRKN